MPLPLPTTLETASPEPRASMSSMDDQEKFDYEDKESKRDTQSVDNATNDINTFFKVQKRESGNMRRLSTLNKFRTPFLTIDKLKIPNSGAKSVDSNYRNHRLALNGIRSSAIYKFLYNQNTLSLNKTIEDLTKKL